MGGATGPMKSGSGRQSASSSSGRFVGFFERLDAGVGVLIDNPPLRPARQMLARDGGQEPHQEFGLIQAGVQVERL
jgi:hypothetical protein